VTHTGYLRRDGCAGPILFPLTTIHTNDSGQGRTTAVLSAPLDTVHWWITYHWGEEPSTVEVACGQVRAQG
jgi:hypothetical protein